MKKIGYLELNPKINDPEESGPTYRGEIQTKSGTQTITAYAGRDKNFCEYLSCWIGGKEPIKFKAVVAESDRDGDYYANLNLNKLVKLIFKRIYNENKNIVKSIDIYV